MDLVSRRWMATRVDGCLVAASGTASSYALRQLTVTTLGFVWPHIWDKPDKHWLLILLPNKGSKGLVDTAGVGIVMAGCGASRTWRPGQAQLTQKGQASFREDIERMECKT